MNKDTFNILHADAEKALSENRFLDALNAIGGMLSSVGSWEQQEELSDLKESYGMLLDCMARGMEDPERGRLLGQFMRRACDLSGEAARSFLLRDPQSGHYAATWHTLQRMQGPLAVAELPQSSCSFRHLFDCTWTSGRWAAADAAAAREIVDGTHFPEAGKCLFLSAATLAALSFFDPAKAEFLLHCTQTESPVLRARALAGAALVCVKHAGRLRFYPEIGMLASLMADDPKFAEALFALQTQLLLSLETKKIEKSLREEILPEVMKNMPRFKFGKSVGIDEMAGKIGEMELNPEWDADGKPSKLGKKMRELAEMQQRGADVFMASFSMMKQKFPFFSVAANWFHPFSPDHPDLRDTFKGRNALFLQFLAGGNLCDSDKYSFGLMLAGMPAAQAEMLQGQLQGAFEAGGQAVQEAAGPLSLRHHLRIYVQDLYRYFKLFRHADPHDDPFRLNLLLTDCKPFAAVLSSEDRLQALADFAFAEKSYGHALHLYALLPSRSLTAEDYQKMGYCHQQEKDFAKAADAYERANLLQAGSRWTLRQLGNCHYALGHLDLALRYYEELERLMPEDTALLLRIGECHIRAGEYEEALGSLFKADYLAPDVPGTVRALAWCSLLAGRQEQCHRYYDKLLALTPTPADCLNAGHAAWLRGDVPAAVGLYRRSLKAEGKDFAPADFFAEDAEILLRQGKTEEELRLMVDILNK